MLNVLTFAGQISGGRVGQLATICRSNATVFSEAVKMVTNDENVKIQFSGVSTYTQE